jgi:hypothetical protein
MEIFAIKVKVKNPYRKFYRVDHSLEKWLMEKKLNFCFFSSFFLIQS